MADPFRTWAAEDPSRVALVDNTSRWTYGELDRRVSSAAARLAELGARPGSSVLVLSPVSATAVAAYLAVVRTGALAVLLDRKAGASDVRHAVERHRPSLVLADEPARPELEGTSATVVTLDLAGADVEPSFESSDHDPGAPAVALFTSGTTERPKTVLHTLDSLRAGARNMAFTTGFRESDSAFLSSPVASITGVMHVHLSLERGGALVLEDRFEPSASLERVRRHGCTVLGGAPVIAEELFRAAQREGVTELPIRSVALGGAMIPRDLLETAIREWGIVPSRVYGSSEAPVATHTLPHDRGDERLVDDGAPADGTQVRIATDGEVQVRGPMLFLRYADPEDQAAAMTEDGWFRTGDLGALRGGRLTVTGRLKEIVIRKGLKVSLPEVDAAARDLPDVLEAAAFGVHDPHTGERVALAVRPERGAPTLESVVASLRAGGLATRKLPEELVVWDGPLPRTATGKVQRSRLAEGGRDRQLAERLLNVDTDIDHEHDERT